MKVKDLEQQKQRLVEQVSGTLFYNNPLFSSKETVLVLHKTITNRDVGGASFRALGAGYMFPALGTSFADLHIFPRLAPVFLVFPPLVLFEYFPALVTGLSCFLALGTV